MHLPEKIGVSDEVRSSLSYGAISREFNVGESTIRII